MCPYVGLHEVLATFVELGKGINTKAKYDAKHSPRAREMFKSEKEYGQWQWQCEERYTVVSYF